MGNNSPQASGPKKQGKSLKEKRAAKHAKQDAQALARKALDK